MHIRPAVPGDLAGLAGEIAAHTRLSSRSGFRLTADLLGRHSFDDPDVSPDQFIVAEKDGRKVGFLLCVHRPWKAGRERTGFIKLLLVHPDFADGAAAHQLLAAGEKALVASNVTCLEFGAAAPLYLLPGVPDDDNDTKTVLREAGWKSSSTRVSLFLDVSSDNTLPGDHLRSGTKPTPFAVIDTPVARGREVLGFIERCFSASWSEEARPAVDSRGEGFCSIAVRRETDEIVGFAAVGASNPGWFGPMGVHPAHRGRGLGRSLFVHALSRARQENISLMTLSWVNDKEGFYTRLAPGCRRQTFTKYTKQLRKPPQ